MLINVTLKTMYNRLHILFPPLYLPPLIGIAIAYIVGISSYFLLHFSAFSYGSIVAILSPLTVLLITAIWQMPQHRIKILWHLIFLVAGLLRSHSSYSALEQFPFKQYAEPVTIKGIITGNTYSSKGRMKHCLTLCAQSACDINGKQTVINRNIQIYLSRKPDITVGDSIEVHDVILKPANGPFKEYLIKEGILTSLFLTNFSYKIIYRPRYSVHRWLWSVRQQLVDNLQKKLSPSVHAFFCAIFLGNRSLDKQEVETISDQFKQWGAVHYMVRAGLHLVMFVGMWYALLSFIPIPFAAKQIIMLILCLLYYLFSWSSIAFMRALLTFIFYKAATLLNLNTHSLHVITMVTLAVLFINPTQLFFLDFQLSFSVTFALAWFNHMYVSPPAQPL